MPSFELISYGQKGQKVIFKKAQTIIIDHDLNVCSLLKNNY